MVVNTNDRMMNDYYFAIIDEVDSILIDEAADSLLFLDQQKIQLRSIKN